MLSNNANTANQVQQKTTGLFTTQTMALKTGARPTVKPNANVNNRNMAPVGQAQQMSHSQRNAGVTMSLGSSSANNASVGYSIRTSGPSMSLSSKMGGFQTGQSKPTFLPSDSSMNKFASATNPAATPKTSMSMFGAQNPSVSSRSNTSGIVMSLGGQANISKMNAPQAPARAQNVVMNATATVSGETEQTTTDNHMDRVFLQQKYDNADHLDPVLKYKNNQYIEELMKNAKALSAPGKGILASDESNGTCGKRFEAIGVENTEANRRDYRELLYTVDGLEEFVSGCIMYDETIRQKTEDGTPFTKVLADKGILTGIKVDTGISVIEGTKDETVTNGLDGLSQRAAEYYEMGARFAKWRAVLKITPDGCPSDVAITETAHSLARYATICQHAGLVPIVEPEILTDGEHDIKTCARISEKVFNAVMNECITQNIFLEGMLLKPNMITSGAQAEKQAGPEEVAFFTVRTLARTIPPAVPGITFLSGGQSEETACQNLSAINQLAEIKHPWNLTYSFGRALQSTVLTTWMGKKENKKAAQDKLFERCQGASQAALGKYEGGTGSTQSDYVANYVY